MLLGIGEAARRLRIDAVTLRRWADSGMVAVQRDSAGRRLFTAEQIDELAQKRAEQKEREAA